MKSNPRLWVLIGLMITVILLKWWDMQSEPGSGTEFALFASGISIDDPKTSTKLKAIANAPVLDFRRDTQLEEIPADLQRNPFIYGVDRRLEQRQQEEFEAIRQRMEAIDVEQEQLEPEPEPASPSFDGHVLGLMEDQETGLIRVAILYQEEIFILHPGDLLADRYQVTHIDYELVRIHPIGSEQAIDIYFEEQPTPAEEGL